MDLQFTSSSFKAKRDNLVEQNKKLQAQLKIMDEHQRQLKPMWVGPSSESFASNYAKDRNKMENFVKAINDYCVALDQIGKQYMTTEKKNLSIVESRRK